MAARTEERLGALGDLTLFLTKEHVLFVRIKEHATFVRTNEHVTVVQNNMKQVEPLNFI